MPHPPAIHVARLQALALDAAEHQISVDLFVMSQVGAEWLVGAPTTCHMHVLAPGIQANVPSLQLGSLCRLPSARCSLQLDPNTPQHTHPLPPLTRPAQGYVDVATLGVLCSNTCGSLYHWCPWSPALDGDEFFNDLRWSLVRPQVSSGGPTWGGCLHDSLHDLFRRGSHGC